MRRVLITGSRELNDPYPVFLALWTQYLQGPLIVVQGDCPDGADAWAKYWAVVNDIPHEDIPADWDRPCDDKCYHKPRMKNGRPYCPMAGHFRNQKMVDLGADICLAFPRGEARGTKDCIRRAEAAGIPVMER